ncbi:MAG: putative portal protein [Prokaryotic dsDNA virus sp.]|nr:MAG: putative portal protein [Prokaryotic dsDNA virus sp.]|tara:strand:+ start:10347 stop:12152 length:1806 start_codon:yes stop_codon:yes gene_type:complete
MASTGSNTADFENVLNRKDGLASEIMALWYRWKSARSLAEQRWAEAKRYVFATSTRETTNVNNPWDNTVHRPKLYHIYNNLLVNTDFSLFPKSDWLEFISFDQQSDSKEKREAALAYLRTKHRLSGFRRVIRKLISDWILYGNCFAGVEYVTEKTLDPLTGEEVVSYQGPRPYRISPYDIVFNPTSISFEDSPKIVKIYKSLGEVEQEIMNGNSMFDEETLRKMKEDRHNFNELNKTERDVNKARAFAADGIGDISNYYNSGHVLLHEFYGDIYDRESGEFLKNHVVTIADGRYILRKQPLNTYSGKPNIYHAVWKDTPDSLWGFGPLNNLVGMQYRINHLENAKADAFDQMLEPDMVFQGDPEIKRVGAAVHYFVSENGNVFPLAPDTTVLNADFQIQKTENDMEEYAGAPREAVGIRSPGEKTAFEVDQLMSRANRVFEYQTNIFSEFLENLINAELEAAKQNLSGSDVVSILDKDFGIEQFVKITREDLRSNGKVVPVGARDAARKARLTSQLNMFYQTGMQDPEVMQHFPAKRVAEMWSEILDFETLYEAYGRIPERLEAQRLQMAAQDMIQEESMIDPTGLSEEQADEQPIEQVPV